jgi:putative pyruvate formate lyase activating enzyme
VTPTHYAEQLLPLLDGILLPVVWNSSGYESVNTLKTLEGKVDIYLPDLKFADGTLAASVSRAPDYPQTARAAIQEMVRQTGPYQMENGLLKKGVLIRHLVLPGQVENSLAVIDWIADTFEKGQVLFSLMSQYTPYRPLGGDWDRKLDKREWIKVRNYMKKRGITEGYVQNLSSANAGYTPAFDFSGI